MKTFFKNNWWLFMKVMGVFVETQEWSIGWVQDLEKSDWESKQKKS